MVSPPPLLDPSDETSYKTPFANTAGLLTVLQNSIEDKTSLSKETQSEILWLAAADGETAKLPPDA